MVAQNILFDHYLDEPAYRAYFNASDFDHVLTPHKLQTPNFVNLHGLSRGTAYLYLEKRWPAILNNLQQDTGYTIQTGLGLHSQEVKELHKVREGTIKFLQDNNFQSYTVNERNGDIILRLTPELEA